jgi:hypothetical protein
MSMFQIAAKNKEVDVYGAAETLIVRTQKKV